MYDSNSRVRIEELLELTDIHDKDLIIVEDDEDTKKSKVKDLKNAFSGDYSKPDRYKFYSSKKIDELLESLNILIAAKAPKKDIDDLLYRVNQIITNNPDGKKDQEVIDARGICDTLGERFNYERLWSDGKYMEKIKKTFIGTLFEEINNGPIKITILPSEDINKDKISTQNISSDIIINTKNRFNIDKSDAMSKYNCNAVIDKDLNGISITEQQFDETIDNYYITINTASPNPAGIYYFMTNIILSETFTNTPTKLEVLYTDGTVEELEYYNEEVFKFEASKAFTGIRIYYNTNTAIDEAKITYTNIMISKQKLGKYIPYKTETKTLESVYDSVEFYNDNYDIRAILSDDYVMSLTYYDQDITTDFIIDKINDIYYILNNKIDKCGLISNYGQYQFFENFDIPSYPIDFKVVDGEKEFIRNGVYSKKLTIDNDATSNPTIKQIISPKIGAVESVSLFFYIDRTTFANFTDSTGINIHLCSDTPEIDITNYYTYKIKKYEMVQGWNCIKRQITEFETTGTPDNRNIQTISIEVERNDNLNGLSFYLNSVAFNQKMKPTVILCFDGTYDTSIDYLYPYLTSRKIPATLFLNSSRTLTAKAFDSIIKLRAVDDWDIGVYGCNPNKEILIKDDNYRNQYIALRASKQWIQDNIIDNPTSYCAPYGNLRPVTVPLLKDFGYNIARTEGTGYISNFTKYDFAIPSQLVGNLNTFDEIKERIDYAIDNNVALCLYTNDVTEYGSEISATQVLFESIINYIIERRDAGDIQCMSLKEFYNECVTE